MTTKRIGELIPGVKRRAMYRRKNGNTYCLLNKELQAKVSIESDGRAYQVGQAEEVDQQEEVEVICDGIPAMSNTSIGPGFRDPASGAIF